MRAWVCGGIGLLIAAAPLTAAAQSSCPASVIVRVNDARVRQAEAEVALAQSKDRARLIHGSMSDALGDALIECSDRVEGGAGVCLDAFESRQRARLAVAFERWLGEGWDTYPDDHANYLEWRRVGLIALDAERRKAAAAGLEALDALESALLEESALLRANTGCV